MPIKYNIIAAFEKEREEGKAEGKAEAVMQLLEENGFVSEDLRERIVGQKDQDILKKWLKLAARTGSVEEFEQQMGNCFSHVG